MTVIIFNKHSPNADPSWCDEIVSVMRPHVLGNPFPISVRAGREAVIRRYAKFLEVAFHARDNALYREIMRLRELHLAGKNIALICCCVPLPCHAEIIRDAIIAKNAANSGLLDGQCGQADGNHLIGQ